MNGAEDTDRVYVEKILPAKMYYNLKAIEKFGFWHDIKTMFMTVFAVCGKKYVDNIETSTVQEKDELEQSEETKVG